MPRIRSIHPDVVDDDVVAGLSAYAFRTWVMLWTHLDDKGRGIDSAQLWAGKLYSLNPKMTPERVEKDLAELADAGLLIRYEVDGKRYLTAKPESWGRWQRPQKPSPSRLPEPPTESRTPSGSRSGSDYANGSGTEGYRSGDVNVGEGCRGGATRLEVVHNRLPLVAEAERLVAKYGNPAIEGA